MNIEIISLDQLLAEAINNPLKFYFITHSGSFHCDEVLGTAVLCQMFDSIKLARVSHVPDYLPQNVICYDIGGGRFDHHQSEGNGFHANGVPYSSFGLLFKEFGKSALMNITNCTDSDAIDKCYEYIESDIVCSIDAADNGVLPVISNIRYSIPGLSSIIKSFLPLDSSDSSDNCFIKAVDFAYGYLGRIYKSDMQRIYSSEYLKNLLSNYTSKDGILVLQKSVPWNRAIYNSPNGGSIMFVIYPSNRNSGYNIHAVAKNPRSNDLRCYFPASWGGLEDRALQQVSGVKTAIFCHKGLFIAGAKTLNDAITLAQKAISCSTNN